MRTQAYELFDFYQVARICYHAGQWHRGLDTALYGLANSGEILDGLLDQLINEACAAWVDAEMADDLEAVEAFRVLVDALIDEKHLLDLHAGVMK